MEDMKVLCNKLSLQSYYFQLATSQNKLKAVLPSSRAGHPGTYGVF